MSPSGTEPTRSSPTPNLTFYAILALVVAFFVWFHVPYDWVSDGVAASLTLLFFLSWVGMPIAVYADIRTVRAQDVDWQPKAPLWIVGCLVPAGNVSVVIPYLLRRYETVNRRESWEYWWRIASGGVGLILLLLLVDVLLFDFLAVDSATVDAVLGELFAVAFLLVAVLVPMAVKYDLAYVERHFDWEPETSLWIVGSAIPFLNVVVVLAYVTKRGPESPYSVLDETETGSSKTEPDVPSSYRSTESDRRHELGRDEREPSGEDEQSATTSVDVDSNWWYWPAITAGLTGLTILVGAGTTAAVGTGMLSITLSLLFLFVLLLVALAVAGCISMLAIHYDAKAIREADANWQPAVIGYLFAAVLITPLVPAIVYVVQRHRYLGKP